MELCAGSCRITRAFCDRGVEAVGVDWHRNRSVPEVRCIMADITKEVGKELVRSIIRSRVVFVFMAPPCGTASRARDKDIPESAKRAGVRRPMPLRSAEYPRGLPHLTGLDETKVTKANAVYDFMVEVAELLLDNDMKFCVENPERSYMWQIPGFVRLAQRQGVFATCLSQCMHSDEASRRNKRSKFLHNVVALNTLVRQCDNGHDHAP